MKERRTSSHGARVPAHQRSGYLRCKRAVDVLLAGVALILFGPVFALIAAVIRCEMGAPVLFRQRRPGHHGQPFRLVKFRTMTTDGTIVPPLGRLLRSLSLDELPQLLNVVRGDMSLVGPRPLLMEYLAHYSPSQARRHLMRPGLTGWAQVNGRNRLTWEEQFDFDVWYVENASLSLDLQIVMRTLRRLVSRDQAEVNSIGERTPFTSSQRRET